MSEPCKVLYQPIASNNGIVALWCVKLSAGARLCIRSSNSSHRMATHKGLQRVPGLGFGELGRDGDCYRLIVCSAPWGHHLVEQKLMLHARAG